MTTEEVNTRIIQLEARIQALELANQRAATEMGSVNNQIQESIRKVERVEEKLAEGTRINEDKLTSRKPLVESKVVNSQKVFTGQRKEFKAWSDKMKNALTSSEESLRDVFKWLEETMASRTQDPN